MNAHLKIHPEAAEELDDAAQWYADQHPSLAHRFLDQIRRAERGISAWPLAGTIFHHSHEGTPVRSLRVATFPYRIFYFLDECELVIIAYAHERRRPNYWRHRLPRAA